MFSWLGSLRTRLVLGNIAITFLAVAGMGFYVTYRAQQSNTYLTTQLNESVHQQAQDQLLSISKDHASNFNTYFISISRDITTLSATLGRILSQQTETGQYWDATVALGRLPSGSWDNSNDEVASVFIPASVELSNPLLFELNATRQIDFIVPTLLDTNQDVVAIYFGGTYGETVYYPNIDLSNIVPADFDVTQRPWYIDAAPDQNPNHEAVWSDPYLDAALHGLIITSSKPVMDEQGNFRGVTAMDIQLTRITDIVADIQVGDTGYVILLDRNMRVIAMPATAYQDLGIDPEALALGDILEPNKATTEISPEFWTLLSNMTSGESGLRTLTIGRTERFVVYQSIPEVDYSLAIIVPSQELLANAIVASEQVAQVTQNTMIVSILLVLGILAIALLAAIGLGNRLTRPLSTLTHTAEEIARGNLNAKAKTGAYGEIDTLAKAFNSMTNRLRETIDTLELRVGERTQNIERQAVLLQTAAEVSHNATSTRDLDALMVQTTHLISNRFGFYHVGIFLVDERGEYAVLRATNSEGGQRMLERGHKLRIGQTGIVGYVTAQGQARIALDVGDDAVYFDNPDLPRTRSEMALPLIASKAILGALDVQSEEAGAFGEQDISTLQVMADQIAIAIENAHLFSEMQAAVESARRAYREISREGWDHLMQDEKEIGYFISSSDKISPASPNPEPEFSQSMKTDVAIRTMDDSILYVPIRVRGEVIGAVRLTKPPEEKWSDSELALASTLTEQLGSALESARLYSDIVKRAQRQQVIGEVTGRIRETLDLDTILQTVVQEMQRAFNVKDAEIRLQTNRDEQISAPEGNTNIQGPDY
jgi:GAF domain-containing protein/HAMP domain-containing protein